MLVLVEVCMSRQVYGMETVFGLWVVLVVLTEYAYNLGLCLGSIPCNRYVGRGSIGLSYMGGLVIKFVCFTLYIIDWYDSLTILARYYI